MDTNTGFYVIYTDGRTRYYDPVLMMYLDGYDSENILFNKNLLNGFDKNAITLDNSINIVPNLHNIFTSTQLSVKPEYDKNAGKSWWNIKKKQAIQWIIFGAVL